MVHYDDTEYSDDAAITKRFEEQIAKMTAEYEEKLLQARYAKERAERDL